MAVAVVRGVEEVACLSASTCGDSLTPFQAIAGSVSVQGGELVEQVSALIERAQSFVAAQANSTLTLRNWHIGRMVDVAVLREARAGHDQKLVASLGRQLTAPPRPQVGGYRGHGGRVDHRCPRRECGSSPWSSAAPGSYRSSHSRKGKDSAGVCDALIEYVSGLPELMKNTLWPWCQGTTKPRGA